MAREYKIKIKDTEEYIYWLHDNGDIEVEHIIINFQEHQEMMDLISRTINCMKNHGHTKLEVNKL